MAKRKPDKKIGGMKWAKILQSYGIGKTGIPEQAL